MLPATHVRLAGAWDETPLWDVTRGAEEGAIEPSDLPISEHLVEAIKEWHREFFRLHAAIADDRDDAERAPDDERVDSEAERRWRNHGRSLANRLQQELGAGYEVIYLEL
jgi:hypothetical protein